MPAICRDGDLGRTGHLCTPVIGVKTTQSSVMATGIPLARLGDPTLPHVIKIGLYCVPHFAKVNMASSTVFAKGIGVARIGDSYDFGAMIQGSQNVYAGG